MWNKATVTFYLTVAPVGPEPCCRTVRQILGRWGGWVVCVGGSQTNRALAQSPISKQCRRAQREPPWGSQEAEMKQKARSNLFVVARTQFFSAARLKGRTVKWNERGITSAAQIRRPLQETGLQYQLKREENKANIVIHCRTWAQVSFV